MNRPFSYHIFSFPFKWVIEDKKRVTLSQKIDLQSIQIPSPSHWVRNPQIRDEASLRNVYNEKNFLYPFVHDTLYDNGTEDTLIKHFERIECLNNAETRYLMKHKSSNRTFSLEIKSISLNMFSSGVGVLAFYLENINYPDFNDILVINQFGRRVAPPFLDLSTGVSGTKDVELADFIELSGFSGTKGLREDFTNFSHTNYWKPGCIIEDLLDEFKESSKIKISPVIDDRMFVACWYGNDRISNELKTNKNLWKTDSRWYRFLFIDGGDSPMCQNDEMQERLLKEHTNPRWQNAGTLHGSSRYSLVCISDQSDFAYDVLSIHMRTLYYRLAELSLVQRASILNFSAEVTRISALKERNSADIADDVRALYREYIRFVNKTYFREVTPQEQGIETYDMLQSQMKISNHINDLDGEIEELHNYVSLLEDKEQNKKLTTLTILGGLFIIPTFISGYFGMNAFSQPHDGFKDEYVVLFILATSISAILATGVVAGWKIKWKSISLLRVILIALAALLVLLILFAPLLFKNRMTLSW